MIWDAKSKEYLDHLDEDHACTVCEGHFDSPSNLEHVGALRACNSGVLMIPRAQSNSHGPHNRVLWMLSEIQDLLAHDSAPRR